MVGFEQRGRIALLTLRRPEARNAVNAEMAAGIEAGIDRLEQEADLWVGVLAAEGPVFSAGADLQVVADGAMDQLFTTQGGFGGITTRSRVKPMITAVDGPALAGGCEMVLACDLVVASRQAAFGLPEVKRSLIAAAGGLFRLPRVLPRNVAMEMALTGDPLPAPRAYELGLVNQLVEPGEALAAALALAERICANAPLAVRESRAVLLASTSGDEAEGWRRSGDAAGRVLQSEDFAEGPRAFLEKRAPQWKAR